MLLNRVLSALVFVPLAVFLIVIGGWPYAGAVTIMLMIGGLEYALIMRQGGYDPYVRTLVLCIGFINVAQAFGWMPAILGPSLALFLIVILIAMLAAYGRGDPRPAVNFGLTLGGALYIGWLGAHFIALRQLTDGTYWALIATLATGCGDIGAYFAGRTLGKHKMSPKISPSKTWEGYFGGIAAATLFGGILASIAAGRGAAITLVQGMLIGAVAGVISPAGDLGMSAIKRMVGVKNFSNLLPGHGGFMDRLDSLLVGIPAAYYLIVFAFLPRR